MKPGRRLTPLITLLAAMILPACVSGAPISPTSFVLRQATLQSLPTVSTPETSNLTPTSSLTSAAPTTDKEMVVLQQSAQLLCPSPQPNPFSSPQLVADGNVYRLSCIFAAGHDTNVSIERFESQAETQTAFRAATLDHISQDYHGYPASAWDQPSSAAPNGKERIWIWQADQWLIQIKSFDDTAYLIALNPGEVAEVLRRIAAEQGLFSK